MDIVSYRVCILTLRMHRLVAGIEHNVQGDEGVLVPQCGRPPHGTQDQEDPGQPRC
jgi:hypothetical protein